MGLTIAMLRSAGRRAMENDTLNEAFDHTPPYPDNTVVKPGELIYAPENIICIWWDRKWLAGVMDDAADMGYGIVSDEDIDAVWDDAKYAIENAVDGETSVYDAVFDVAYEYFKKKGGEDDEH